MESQKRLLVLYDVSALTDDEIGRLELEACVQAEASDADEWSVGHPDVPVVSAVYERPAMSEIPISDEADAVAEVMGGDPPSDSGKRGWRRHIPPFAFWWGAGCGMLAVGTTFTEALRITAVAAVIWVGLVWAIATLGRYVADLVVGS